MAPKKSPLPQRRKQSAGALQATETEPSHPPPVWPKDTTTPKDDTAGATDEYSGDDISIESDSLDQESSTGPVEMGDKNENADNNLDTDTDLNRKNEVKFRQQMSYISNLSQITLNLSCKERYISWRYSVAMLMHCAFVVAIFVRNGMPIALVCMTDPSPRHHDSSESGDNFSSLGEMSRNDSLNDYEFHWDLNTQSLILSGVQFSSCVGPLLCDFIRLKVGSKHTMTVCMLLAAVVTFASPTAARISPWALFTTRVLLGIFLGANVSTTADLLSWWSPAAEKQTMMSLVFAGSLFNTVCIVDGGRPLYLSCPDGMKTAVMAFFAGVNMGGIITSLAAGFLCSVPLDNGWPFIFYVFGFATLVVTVAWHFLNADKPEDHPFITELECNFIMNYRTPIDSGPKGKPEKPPYKKIFTSVPVLCFLASSASQVWTSSLYFTVLPNFFVTVYKFTVEEAGIIMSLVSAARFIGIPVWTMAINRLRKGNVTNTKTKKIILGAGYGASAILQLAILFLDYEYRWVAVGLFLLLLGCQVSGMCVYTVLPMDMAPRYAGFLSGLFYSIGSLVSISAPLMVAALAPNSTREEWRIIWIIVAAVFVIAIAIFAAFGDANVQPWARVHRDSRPNIQSAFVSMGRRISAVLDGPISNSPAVRGNRNFSLTTLPTGVSLAPSGSDHSMSNQEAESIVSTHINTRMSPPSKLHYDSNGHHTPKEGVANAGFEPEVNARGDEGPEMVDKVTRPSQLSDVEELEGDSLEERFSKGQLRYIDEPTDPTETDAQPQITRL